MDWEGEWEKVGDEGSTTLTHLVTIPLLLLK